jgi:hypothetical protein
LNPVSPLAADPHPRLGRLLALLLLLASLANGAPFLLARIGLIAPEAYQRDRQAFCPQAGPPAGLVSACSSRRPDPGRPGRLQALPFKRLHRAASSWRPWKLWRLLLLLGLPLAAWIRWGHACLPAWRRLWPALPLLLSSILAFLISLAQPLPARVLLASLLPLAWLAPLLAAGPFASRPWLVHWARAASWLLWLQLPLLLLEAWRGLPMPFGPPPSFAGGSGTVPLPAVALPTRLVGSFIHPNALGVAVVVLLGFALSYLPTHQENRQASAAAIRPGLWLAALVSLLLSRSATGVISLLALLLWRAAPTWLARRRSLGRLAPVLLLVLPLLGGLLPRLLGRPDLWQSPLGRWQALTTGMADAGLLQWLLGQGLAANSNQLLSLLGPQAALHSADSDSMLVLLLLQSGLVGLAAFYGLLLWAWRCDPHARPFLLCLGLASLTLNITELFPLNLLLGLSLAGLLNPCPELPGRAAAGNPGSDSAASRTNPPP